jgi:hypothetical protein
MIVYLISAEISGSKLHKIGYTRRTIDKRIKEFKTGNASEFFVIESFKSKWGTKIESRLHKLFKNKLVSGEWFNLNEDDVYSFIETCQTIHDNYELLSESTYYLEKGKF